MNQLIYIAYVYINNINLSIADSLAYHSNIFCTFPLHVQTLHVYVNW
jgi:hypothetical protein